MCFFSLLFVHVQSTWRLPSKQIVHAFLRLPANDYVFLFVSFLNYTSRYLGYGMGYELKSFVDWVLGRNVLLLDALFCLCINLFLFIEFTGLGSQSLRLRNVHWLLSRLLPDWLIRFNPFKWSRNLPINRLNLPSRLPDLRSHLDALISDVLVHRFVDICDYGADVIIGDFVVNVWFSESVTFVRDVGIVRWLLGRDFDVQEPHVRLLLWGIWWLLWRVWWNLNLLRR